MRLLIRIINYVIMLYRSQSPSSIFIYIIINFLTKPTFDKTKDKWVQKRTSGLTDL